MKKIFTLVVLSGAITLIACHTKKQTSNTDSKPAATPAATAPASNGGGGNGGVGISIATVPRATSYYEPGAAELQALQITHPDANLQQLQEGHKIYTAGACIGCHEPKNIFNGDMPGWQRTIDDMAFRARLTPPEKEAVYRYVLAIKTANPNSNK